MKKVFCIFLILILVFASTISAFASTVCGEVKTGVTDVGINGYVHNDYRYEAVVSALCIAQGLNFGNLSNVSTAHAVRSMYYILLSYGGTAAINALDQIVASFTPGLNYTFTVPQVLVDALSMYYSDLYTIYAKANFAGFYMGIMQDQTEIYDFLSTQGILVGAYSTNGSTPIMGLRPSSTSGSTITHYLQSSYLLNEPSFLKPYGSNPVSHYIAGSGNGAVGVIQVNSNPYIVVVRNSNDYADYDTYDVNNKFYFGPNNSLTSGNVYYCKQDGYGGTSIRGSWTTQFCMPTNVSYLAGASGDDALKADMEITIPASLTNNDNSALSCSDYRDLIWSITRSSVVGGGGGDVPPVDVSGLSEILSYGNSALTSIATLLTTAPYIYIVCFGLLIFILTLFFKLIR